MDRAGFEEAVARLLAQDQQQNKTESAAAVVSLLSHDFPVVPTRQLQLLANAVEQNPLQVFKDK